MHRTIQRRVAMAASSDFLSKSFIAGSYITTNHLPQLVFFCKLSAQDLQIANQTLAAVY
jgi:hypothetical protein